MENFLKKCQATRRIPRDASMKKTVRSRKKTAREAGSKAAETGKKRGTPKRGGTKKR